MRHLLTLVVVLSLVTYRVTRFILEDSLIAQPRLWFKAKLLGAETRDDHELDLTYEAELAAGDSEIPEWRMKLFELLDCPWCMSVWAGAGAVALTDHWSSVPLPVWAWLCASAGAVVIWRYAES